MRFEDSNYLYKYLYMATLLALITDFVVIKISQQHRIIPVKLEDHLYVVTTRSFVHKHLLHKKYYEILKYKYPRSLVYRLI